MAFFGIGGRGAPYNYLRRRPGDGGGSRYRNDGRNGAAGLEVLAGAGVPGIEQPGAIQLPANPGLRFWGQPDAAGGGFDEGADLGDAERDD